MAYSSLELLLQFLRWPRVMPLPAQLLRVDGLDRASVVTGPAAVAEALVEVREGVEPDGLVGAAFLAFAAPGADRCVHELGPLCLLGPVTPHVACDGAQDSSRHGDLLDGLPVLDVLELAAKVRDEVLEFLQLMLIGHAGVLVPPCKDRRIVVWDPEPVGRLF